MARVRGGNNVFVERLWRSVKYEEIYLRAYDSVGEARGRVHAMQLRSLKDRIQRRGDLRAQATGQREDLRALMRSKETARTTRRL